MQYEYENSKKSISDDLEQLAELLNDYGLCKDTSSLYQASNLRYDTVGNNWKYYINIPITINTVPAHIRPIEVECLEINFSIQVMGVFLEEVWGIQRSGFFNGRGKWAKGFENQMV